MSEATTTVSSVYDAVIYRLPRPASGRTIAQQVPLPYVVASNGSTAMGVEFTASDPHILHDALERIFSEYEDVMRNLAA
jgi:hypothetical protein